MAAGYPKVFKKADSFSGYNEIPGTYDGGTSVSLANSQANHPGVCSSMQRTFFKVVGRGVDATSEVVCTSTLPLFTGTSSPAVAQVNHQGSNQETRVTPGPVSGCTFTAVKQGSNCVVSVSQITFPRESSRKLSFFKELNLGQRADSFFKRTCRNGLRKSLASVNSSNRNNAWNFNANDDGNMNLNNDNRDNNNSVQCVGR